jgi:hypothetical protein
MTDSIEVLLLSGPLQVEIVQKAESDVASYIVRYKKTTVQEEPPLGKGWGVSGLRMLEGYTSSPALALGGSSGPTGTRAVRLDIDYLR